eukprot:5656989-Prymnesium_polylepis.1
MPHACARARPSAHQHTCHTRPQAPEGVHRTDCRRGARAGTVLQGQSVRKAPGVRRRVKATRGHGVACLREEGEHDEEEHEVDVLEEVQQMLGVVVDVRRDRRDHAKLDHHVRDERDEAEDGELAEHGVHHGRHHRRHLVLHVVLRDLEDDRHRDQKDTDAERHLHVEQRVAVVARELPPLLDLARRLVAVRLLVVVIALRACALLQRQAVDVHESQHADDDEHVAE